MVNGHNQVKFRISQCASLYCKGFENNLPLFQSLWKLAFMFLTIHNCIWSMHLNMGLERKLKGMLKANFTGNGIKAMNGTRSFYLLPGHNMVLSRMRSTNIYNHITFWLHIHNTMYVGIVGAYTTPRLEFRGPTNIWDQLQSLHTLTQLH